MWCAGTLLLPRSYHGCLAAAGVDSGATGGVCVAAVDFLRAAGVQRLHMGAGEKC